MTIVYENHGAYAATVEQQLLEGLNEVLLKIDLVKILPVEEFDQNQSSFSIQRCIVVSSEILFKMMSLLFLTWHPKYSLLVSL